MKATCEQLEKQLDEAKPFIKMLINYITASKASLSSFPSAQNALDIQERKARAFLASLAGRDEDVVIFDRDGSRTRKQPEQPQEEFIQVSRKDLETMVKNLDSIGGYDEFSDGIIEETKEHFTNTYLTPTPEAEGGVL